MNCPSSVKLRARIPNSTSLSYTSPDSSVIVVAQKPSKLSLFKKSDYNEDPFNLGTGENSTNSQDLVPTDYQLAKEIDLKVGTLIFMQWVEFDTEPAFVIVSNDKALLVLDKELQEIFRNEELLGSTDLCFFTSVDIRRNKEQVLQGNLNFFFVFFLYELFCGYFQYIINSTLWNKYRRTYYF